MAELKEITDENYENEIFNSKDIWCVTFSALSFCQPCKALHNVLLDIAKNDKVPGIKFGTVATEDKGINFSSDQVIKSVPTTKIFRGQEILGTKLGFVPEKDFIEFVKSTAKI